MVRVVKMLGMGGMFSSDFTEFLTKLQWMLLSLFIK